MSKYRRPWRASQSAS